MEITARVQIGRSSDGHYSFLINLRHHGKNIGISRGTVVDNNCTLNRASVIGASAAMNFLYIAGKLCPKLGLPYQHELIIETMTSYVHDHAGGDLNRWMLNGWKKANGVQVSHADEWLQLLDLSRLFVRVTMKKCDYDSYDEYNEMWYYQYVVSQLDFEGTGLEFEYLLQPDGGCIEQGVVTTKRSETYYSGDHTTYGAGVSTSSSSITF